MLAVIKKLVHIPVFVMIRPRAGDFLFSDDELAVMKQDIIHLKKAGADGFVFGILTENGEVDAPRCKELLDIIRPLPATFHRAIDMTQDIFKALDDIMTLGFDRVLSSGGCATAHKGVEVLREMISKAGNKMVVMPGGGITENNLKDILSCGAKEFHGSARCKLPSTMKFRKSDLSMGSDLGKEYEASVTSKEMVQSLVKIAKDMWS
ncbi:copper homeostasis protein cutC homolog isoform X2 [Aplysia californica]|nr:copper homeostasis protein cutC homolog isoform X2 [Aplysia californica]XP_005093480.1 copper homeostasis protein cutC homolog isoform X2 [Aplysia californica]